MHEMSIADGLLREVLIAMAPHGAVRLETVSVEIGVLSQVVPESLEMAWQALSEGTPAEGGELEITETAPSARCRQCGLVFAPAVESFLCPSCGLADVDILAGNDIILKALTCDSDQGAPVDED